MKKSVGMKKSVSILDMLKNQDQITCPACGLKLPRLKLNSHLDMECSSVAKDKNIDTKVDIALETDIDDLKPTKQSINGLQVKKNDIKYNESCKQKSEMSSNAKTVSMSEAIEKVNSERFARNTSAPWRAQSTKRKHKNSPVKRGTLGKKDVNFIKNKSNIQVISSKEPEFSDSKESEPTASIDSISSENLDNDLSSIDFSEDVFEIGDLANTPDSQTPYSPYYLANFKHILIKVLEDDFNKHLFNELDMSHVQTFNSLSDGAQKLYVRLFQRKYKWLRPTQINYPQIAQDLTRFLQELLKCGLLDSGSRTNMELETALNLLSLPEAKMLSKQFNFNSSGKSKSEICELLIKHGKQHKSFFSVGGKSCISSAILKKVIQVLGPCYILQLEPKRLFTRILMLFSLPTMAEDDEEGAGGQQQQLLTLLQVNKGQLVFPAYKINRECIIFETRDDLIRYVGARQLETEILNAVEAKNFSFGKELYLKAEKEFSELKSCGHTKRDEMLPQHLRRYTAGHVYTRCLNQGVEILQRLRQYEEAVQLLRVLLEQKIYGQDRKGKWWDRLALNLDQHLRRSNEVASVLKDAMEDPNVRVGLRLALLTRAKRIFKKHGDKALEEYIEGMNNIIDCPKVTIRGQLLPHPIPGRKHVFISSNYEENSHERDVTVLGVEQLAIEHYKSIGFTEGVHGEGSTFISLYTLLFWDIIYDGNIVDVFISPYQAHPLDLNSFDFYDRRKDQIDNHLETIRKSSVEDLVEIVRSSWEAHTGMTSLVNWEIFTDVEHVLGLVTCLGTVILPGICERLAKDFRFTRSGVPDLVVWNPDTKLVKIVEVKGPGDKLSTKQILWLDYLLKIGAEAEVCLVEAVGSKKLKRNEDCFSE